MKIQQAVAISLDTYAFTGYVKSNKKDIISMKNLVGAKKADASCVEVMMWDFVENRSGNRRVASASCRFVRVSLTIY
jgi:hypothetical protein